jgi:hypothetical protein
MKALPWLGVALVLMGSVMLLIGTGASVIWFSNIAVGSGVVRHLQSA